MSTTKADLVRLLRESATRLQWWETAGVQAPLSDTARMVSRLNRAAKDLEQTGIKDSKEHD
jgi:hypothetical protein